MLSTNNDRQCNESNWQSAFLEMLPEITRWLQVAFRKLDAEAREDAVEEAIVHSLLSFSRLYCGGRGRLVNASSLAWYAALAIKSGRPAVGRSNSKEPLSRYALARAGNGIRFERQNGEWIDKLVVDKRASIPDQVAAKLDVSSWFASLTERMKKIARDLAMGCSTSEVAKTHGISPGRISQLRRILEESWTAFQQDGVSGIG